MDKATLTLHKVYASLPKTERGQYIKLGAHPKGDTFLYTNDTSVFIRDAKDPSESDIVTQHAKEATVARYSPSGFYVASGDVTGKIRIWDTTQKEHILKHEYTVLGGKVHDINWSPDNQRLVIVGEGREVFAAAILMNTGSTVGNFTGIGKICNAVAYSPQRPFRLAIGLEDRFVALFEGPPFKYSRSIEYKGGYVNCVKYAPNGTVFISGSSLGEAQIHDGNTGQIVGKLGDPAHKGGIYDIAFSHDSTMVLTCSGDKTAKIWSMPDGNLINEVVFGNELNDMQVGCTWLHSELEDHLITVSLSGFINYLDKDSGKVKQVIKGHKKAITAMTIHNGTIYSASYDGRLLYWYDHLSEEIKIKKDVDVKDIAVSDGQVNVIQQDCTLSFINEETKDVKSQVKLESEPVCIAAVSGVIVAACLKHVVVYKDNQKLFAQAVDYSPSSVALHKDGNLVAIGGKSDKTIRFLKIGSSGLTEEKCLTFLESATALQFSPDGNFFASTLANCKVLVHSLPDYEVIVEGGRHTAKINSLSWSSDSTLFATGSLDAGIIVWSRTNKRSPIAHFPRAHHQKSVNCVGWLDQSTVVSAGQDCNIKLWKLEADQ